MKIKSVGALAASFACLLVFPPIRTAADDSRPALALKQVAEGLTSPVVLTPLEDGSGRLLIVDQVGTVHVRNTDGTVADKLFFDARSRLTKLNEGFDERGLLGLALHPKFSENRRLFVVYSAPLRDKSLQLAKWDNTLTVSELKVTENDRAQVDAASERVLLQIDKPWFNHNGGCLAFGPDGLLFMSVGDGGNGNDTGRGHTLTLERRGFT